MSWVTDNLNNALGTWNDKRKPANLAANGLSCPSMVEISGIEPLTS